MKCKSGTERVLYPAALLLWVALAFMALPISQAQDKPADKPRTDLQTLVDGNTEFAFDLFARLAEKKGNVVFSPYSISNALGMTYAGARRETAEQMAKVLHFNVGQERLHPAFGELIADLQKEDKGRPYHLHVANSLWGQAGYPFADRFLQLTRKEYGAGLKEVDFAVDPEQARKTINHWVEERTKDKIKELLLPGDVSPNTRLVLTNAIYFKATWKIPFSKTATKEGIFEVAADKKALAPMMHHPRGLFRYFEGDDFQWLELPYKGDRLAMVLLLPRKKGQLAELEKTLKPAAAQKAIEKLHYCAGPVTLPRFKVTLRISLAKDLKEMGMPLAFTNADFSGIASSRLAISDVIHKAYVDVDEAGTEAAAATAVLLKDGKVRSFSFRADHPFLFLIRDTQTNSVLFQGRVTDPRLQ